MIPDIPGEGSFKIAWTVELKVLIQDPAWICVNWAENLRMVNIEIKTWSPFFLISRLNNACFPLLINLQSWKLKNGLSLIPIAKLIWRLKTRGEQALFNLEIKKKSVSSINPDIHHSKVSSSD